MLQFAEIALGVSGGPRCRRPQGVATESLRSAPEVLADIATAAGSWAHGPGPNIAFTGVEPFSHRDLFSFIQAAVDAGAERIRLDSDALALQSSDAARSAIHAGVRHLQFGLFGSTAALHDAFTGAPGSFEGTLQGVSCFTDTAAVLGERVQVSACVPVFRRNLRDVPAIVATAAKARVSFVRLVLEDETLSPWTAAPWIEAGCDSGIVNTTWVEVEGVPFGAAQGWELHLASIYHPVTGNKGPACFSCPLDAVCGGVATGAASQLTERLRPPSGAEEMAACVIRSFGGPQERTDG